MQDENRLIAERRRKLDALRTRGVAFPNDFRRNTEAATLHSRYADWSDAALREEAVEVAVAGRMLAKRIMGKASFAKIRDASGDLQWFLQRDALGEEVYADFRNWDLGDWLGAKGSLFRTRTGELTLAVTELRLLSKNLRPLPEKFHGLADQEMRYRQRYVDLITSEETRQRFRVRSRIIECIRAYFLRAGFLEVETPMMHPIAGGATARPFITHHNALDRDLYLRIAPELYLKRLLTGGLDRVFEINRSFRNEGLSTRHNPEFTMLEYYEAFVAYPELMDRTEELLRTLSLEVSNALVMNYQGETIDFAPAFRRMSVAEAILAYNPDLQANDLEEIDRLRAHCQRLGIPVQPDAGRGKLWLEIFEKTAEQQLRQPTFITGYPIEVSPLARRNDQDPFLADRFEFFVGGREIANGFSELNDPEDQAERFRAQVRAKEAGDEEAMHFDADYIRALEYGMPPAAGEGIGIDRLVMLFTNSPSIRDVLLFPQMGLERR